MKFSCIQENLNRGLYFVSHVASKGSSLPILGNILFKTTAGGLELIATNLEVAVNTTIRGRVEGEGAVTVLGRLISEVVALLPNEKVTIEIEGNTLIVVGGKSRTIIKGLSADEFPVIPGVKELFTININKDELVKSLNRVIFAVNLDEGRPEISGIFLGKTQKGLVVVGTDSYRLAEAVFSDQGGVQTEGLIIPLRAAQELARIGQGVEATEVVVVVGDNQILWQMGEVKIVSRLVSGQYPDYQQIIPKEVKTTAVVDLEKLKQAVRAASLFVRSGINDVRLSFDVNKGVVLVSSNNSQTGENNTEVEAEIKGESVDIVFNYKYLLDGLNALDGREVVLKISGSNNPSLMEGKDNTSYRYLIMPIRQ